MKNLSQDSNRLWKKIFHSNLSFIKKFQKIFWWTGKRPEIESLLWNIFFLYSNCHWTFRSTKQDSSMLSRVFYRRSYNLPKVQNMQFAERRNQVPDAVYFGSEWRDDDVPCTASRMWHRHEANLRCRDVCADAWWTQCDSSLVSRIRCTWFHPRLVGDSWIYQQINSIGFICTLNSSLKWIPCTLHPKCKNFTADWYKKNRVYDQNPTRAQNDNYPDKNESFPSSLKLKKNQFGNDGEMEQALSNLIK